MEKPTFSQIKEFADNKVNYSSISGDDGYIIVKFTGKFKDSDANSFCGLVNSAFGQWVYASTNFTYRDYSSVSISFRSKELSKCKYCGCLDGMHNYCPTVMTCKTPLFYLVFILHPNLNKNKVTFVMSLTT